MNIGIITTVGHSSGGIYHYTKSVIEALHTISPYNFTLFLMPGSQLDVSFVNKPNWRIEVLDVSIITRQADIEANVAGNGIDAIANGFNKYATNYFCYREIGLLIYPAPWSFSFECGIPYVMAVHDLQHHLQPEFPEVSAGGEWGRREYLFRNGVRFARGILVDSEVGKEDVLHCYPEYAVDGNIFILPFVPAIISSIHNGDTSRDDHALSNYGLSANYFFYPAQFWAHKNHARIVEALHLLKMNYSIEIPLVLVGSYEGPPHEMRKQVFDDMMGLAIRLGVAHLVRYLGYVPDMDMPVLYRNALALVMPTFFGPTNIPILEAWAEGCPVLTSDIRGVREQAGDAALLVDPREVSCIANGMYRICSDKNFRDAIVTNGYVKLSKLSREMFATKLAAYIAKAVEPSVSPRRLVFPDSRLAHHWLDNLQGLEIGPSAHNPFGLNTKNVGMKDEVYEAEQLSIAGAAAHLDIVSRADDIPLPDESEDFILSSHVVEHCPDLIKTLVEWYRIVRPGGYIFMIIPHRDAAPSDRGRPLTDWQHILSDFRNGASELTEPEAGKFGHCHYHVFSPETMKDFVSRIFEERLKLVDFQDVDDKQGNGFSLVFRKEELDLQSRPWEYAPQGAWNVQHKSGEILVSAIVSTYNSELFMRGCLEDLTSQSLFNKGWMEIIVVDSASPEQEGKIVKDFQARYKNIIYIRTDQRETIYQAWNRGIRAARGKYVTNANTDDRHRTDALEVLVKALESHPQVCLAYADVFVTNLPNQTFENHVRYGYHIRPEFSPDIMLSGCHMGPQPMWRKGVHAQIGWFHDQLKSAGDYEFWCRIALHAPLLHVAEFLGLYYENPKGFCNVDLGLSVQETVLVKQAYSDRLPLPHRGYTNNLQYTGPAEARRFVNICMITYNRLEFTRQAIDALLLNTDFPNVLTVVDNASSDGTQEYLQEQKRLGIIKNLVLLDENVGVAKASNLAWSLEPDAEYYLKLDNDIVINKTGWLSDMANVLDFLPEAGAVAYNFEPQSYQLSDVRGINVRVKNTGNLGGACILIPKRTHQLLGFWCEDYGLYGEEDADLGSRINFAGLKNVYMEDEEVGFHLPAGKAAKIDNQFVANDGIEESLHSSYRVWKDEARRSNVLSGMFANNVNKYTAAGAATYLKSRYVEQFRGRQAEFPLKTDRSTPLKIGVFSLDLKECACPQIRLIAPFASFGESVQLAWGTELIDATYGIDINVIDTADVIVIQRFFPRLATVPIIERMFATGKPVIYEADDLITDIPDYNLNKSWAEETVRLLPDILPRCSAIIASADLLAEAFRSYNQSIYVLPNLIDEKVWKTSPQKALNTPIVIGFAGTATHRADLEVVEPALFRIAQKYGDRVAFRFMGEAYKELTTLPGFSFIPFERGYNSYARTLGEAGFDIALVPLKDNSFNRCKSNIKWLEYSICGVAGIYSDLPPYNSCIRHGATGVLVDNDPDKWYQALSLLIEHPQMRHEIARNSHAVVSNHYTIRAKAHKYIDTYREIIVAHQTNLINLNNVNQVKVSIIIPLFNNMSYTRQCLEQLRQNTNAELYELILVDNGCTDDTYTLFGAMPANVKVIRNLKNQGFAKACNQGAEAANGKYLLFLNNDTEPQPGWLEPLLTSAELDSGIAAVGSKLLFPDGTIQHAGVVIAEDHVTPDLLVGKHIYYGFPTDHPAVNISRGYQALTAACLLVRRDAFEDVQGFDEGYWNGYEDVDLCFKLGQKGWKLIYQPASILIHHESKSGIERFTRVAQNITRLHQKWLGTINPDLIINADSREECLCDVASVTTLPDPLVSIVIPLFNQAQLTKACIEAIRATAGDPGRYELILVDNGSWDWTPEYLKTLGNTANAITNSDNVGFAKACNQAAKLAKAKYLLFLNNDTVPQAGWLDAMLAGTNKDGADIVGAKLLYPNGRVQHAGVSFNKNGIGYHIFKNFEADAPAVNKKRFMQCVTAACMLVSKQLFNELDGFDERFQNGFEDVDFCLRAGLIGKRVLYTPDAVVIHIEEQSEGRKQHDHQNMQLYLTRWHGSVDCDDEKFYAAEGFTVEWHVNGTCVVRPCSAQEVIHEKSRYPLIPLVGNSSSSILQKLSSSQRLKGVLKRYTLED